MAIIYLVPTLPRGNAYGINRSYLYINTLNSGAKQIEACFEYVTSMVQVYAFPRGSAMAFT